MWENFSKLNPPTNSSVDNDEEALDDTRLMCWPHVFHALSKTIKSIPNEAAKEILDNIATFQLPTINLQRVTGLLVLGLWTITMVLKELMKTSKKLK